MGAIAERRRRSLLAEAPGDGGLLLDHHFYRSPARSLMAAIAEGLVGRLSTGAPPIGAGFHLLNGGLGSANFGRFHSGNFSKERPILKETAPLSEKTPEGSRRASLRRVTERISPR